MKAPIGIRILSGFGAPWRVVRGSTAITTARGQDKSAHIALRSGRCFSWCFPRVRHLVAQGGKVRTSLRSFTINGSPHIERRHHGR